MDDDLRVLLTLEVQVEGAAALQALASDLDAVAEAARAAQSAWGDAAGVAGAQDAVDAFSAIAARVPEAVSQARDATSTALGSLDADWHATWGGMAAEASAAWSDVDAATASDTASLVSLVEQAMGAVTAQWHALWSDVDAAAGTAWSTVAAATSSGAATVVSDVGQATGVLTSNWRAAWNDVVAAVDGASKTVDAGTRELVDAALTDVRDGAAPFVGAGLALADGLAQGIADGAGHVADVARQTAQQAIDAAKATLGISSPSRAFLEIGQLTVEGMVGGMQAGAADAAAAGAAIGGSAAQGARDPDTSPPLHRGSPWSVALGLNAGPLPALAGSPGSGGVQITVYVQDGAVRAAGVDDGSGQMVGQTIAAALDQLWRSQLRVQPGAASLLPGAVGP